MEIIGALYERGRCRNHQEIARGRRPWNPTLQKTKGGARGIMGSWHKISAKHLSAYLDDNDLPLQSSEGREFVLDTLRHMVTAHPLTFEALTAESA
jgi:hypothetical protein